MASNPFSLRLWKEEEDGKNKKHNPGHRVAQVFRKRREQQLLLHGLDGEGVAQGTKQRKRKNTKGQHSHINILLTDDAVAEILSWLPVKSLIRFRCVCKSWCSLTYDPYFQKQQHERSATATRTSIAAYIVNEEYAPFTMRTYSLGMDNKRITDCSFKLTIPPPQGRDGDGVLERYLEIRNSVNGLTCLYDYGTEGDCYLLNPSTREVEKLPKSRNNGWTNCLGLGFDSSTGVYKAVRVFKHDGGNGFFGYETLTLGGASQQWRFIREIPCLLIDAMELVFVNGAFHWLAYPFKRTNEYPSRHMKIFTINIRDDKYGSISTPVPCCHHDKNNRVLLQDGLQGRLLFLMHSERPKHQVRMWTMKDYASREWTNTHIVNMYSLPCPLDLIGIAYDNVLFRLSTRASKKMVEKIFCYDLGRKTCQKEYWKVVGDAIFYTESLFSPRKILSNSINVGIKM